MSRSLMLKAAIAVLLTTASAEAKECFTSVEDPKWSIEVDEPEWTWKQGDEKLSLTTESIGTGIPKRIARDASGNPYVYLLHKGDLIVDMVVYEPGPCSE